MSYTFLAGIRKQELQTNFWMKELLEKGQQ
jgi:hypothetical protein